MELFKMIFNAENVRTAVLLVAAACGFIWLKTKLVKSFDDKIHSLREEMNTRFTAQGNDMNARFTAQDEKIASLRDDMNARFTAQDEKIASLRGDMNERFTAQDVQIRELKTNDIAHLYAAIEALIFSMVKNATLTETDQQYINDRLHSTH
jgi:hypothetical protein